jgi:3D (Asp-Asp-Asp) domain-containing protein
VFVDDGGVPYSFLTTASTLGEAFLEEEITIFLGDIVKPGLGTRITPGLKSFIERSTPVFVSADNLTVQTRTRGKTVGDALVDLGIVVAGSDRVSPPLGQDLHDNTLIQVTRVLETVLVDRESIPYESILAPDDNLEIDRQRMDQPGAEGEHRRRYKIVYENGVEVQRELLDDWVASEPITRGVAYGRKIVSRPLETPEGTLSYWRVVRMMATSYSASTAGVAADSYHYGITYTGLPMRKGIVAVDPSIVPLRSRVYVPGYGIGDAADVGGAIRSRRIDLGYDDWNLALWYRWVDVYLLDPPPDRSKIRWVLPNWPPQR